MVTHTEFKLYNTSVVGERMASAVDIIPTVKNTALCRQLLIFTRFKRTYNLDEDTCSRKTMPFI